MEKTLKILEGILERHHCRRNAMHVLCPKETLDDEGQLVWRPCGCEDCLAIGKAVKRLKKAMETNAKPDSTTPGAVE